MDAMGTSHGSGQDEKFMSIALHEAGQALDAGDYPVGAVLAINGELIGQARNSIFTESQTTAHAEQKILSSNSARLRQLRRGNKGLDIHLYTTLEPCLMCLGAAVLHHVTRIIFACPDPHGGATKVDPNSLGCFYAGHWPIIEAGPMKETAVDLILKFLQTGEFSSSETMLREFSKMKESW
jgi:tRNA(adenine34) deaminase